MTDDTTADDLEYSSEPAVRIWIPEDEPHRRGMYADLVDEHGADRVDAQLQDALQPNLIAAITQLWDNREAIDWDAYDQEDE